MTRKDLLETGKLVRYEPVMLDWMLAYAEWLVTCVRPPSRTERRVTLANLSKRPCAKQHIEELENRKDFRRYVDDLQKGPLERARAKFMAKLPKLIDMHEQAADLAMAAGDYRAIPAFTIPAIDRAAPKKQEVGNAVQVNVTLSPERLAGFADDYQPAEVEALPAPELSDNPQP